ncbi:hypothetical protein BDV12DRAFT_27752 [Aspergillus spectabilis]
MTGTDEADVSSNADETPKQVQGCMVDAMLRELHRVVMRRLPITVADMLMNRDYPIDRAVIRYAAVTYFHKSVFEVVATCLAERRRELFSLARKHLSEGQLQKMGVRPEQRILDWQSAPVAAALLESNSVDPDTIRYFVPDLPWASSGTSVYFLVGCNRDAAQILYDVGFEGIDEVDQLMYSPLAALDIPILSGDHGHYQVRNFPGALSEFIAMCEWLYDRGASLHRVFGLAQATPLHHIAGRIGRYLADSLTARFEISGDVNGAGATRRFIQVWVDTLRPLIMNSHLLQEILRDLEHHDLFACPCSLGGSLAVNVLLNETINGVRSPKTICALVSVLVRDTRNERLASVVFRLCCFACLGIPHTCRSASLQRLSIMQEGAPAVDTILDTLVAEFDNQFRRLDVPLARFLLDFWMPRMENFQRRYFSYDGVWYDSVAGREMMN